MRHVMVASLILLVACSSEPQRAAEKPTPPQRSEPATAPPAPEPQEPAPIVLKGQKDAPRRIKGESPPKTADEVAADEAQERRVRELEAKARAPHEPERPLRAPSKGSADADHISGLSVSIESGRALVTFSVVNAKGDAVVVAGHATVYTRYPGRSPSRIFGSSNVDLGAPQGPETQATDQDVSPEGRLYRLNAFDAPKDSESIVRLVFSLPSGRSFESTTRVSR